MMCIPLGINLHDTLCFCLVDQKRDVIKDDVPLWERDPAILPITDSKRVPRGSADLYTWPARMILLEKSAVDGVTNIRFITGLGCEPDTMFIDPMLAYTYSKEKGKYAVPFREGRGTWRDFDSLLPDNATLAPAVIEHATALTRHDPARFPYSVMVLGQSSDKAKIEFWRMERFALPEALLGQRSIRTEIHQLLADAETNQQALWRACRSFARDLLSRGERDPDAKDISRFVEQMPVSAVYWSTLEAAFHDVLRHYTADSDPDAIRLGWLKTVRSTLRHAWQLHTASVSTSALVRAEAHVKKQIGALNKEIQQYETHFESQRQSQEEPA
jgi:CRISPR system Cascade subunit CasA